MEKQENKLKKLYVCREHHGEIDIISKVLIGFEDDSYTYFRLFSDNEMSLEELKQNHDLILKDLNSYIKEMFNKNNNYNSDLNDVQIIFVQPDDLELQKFVNDRIKNADIQDIKADEKGKMVIGYIFYLLAMSGMMINNNPIFSISINMLNSFLSSLNFYKATRYNRELKLLQVPNQLLRKIKFSFSCLMLSLNIGFSCANLCVNFDALQQDIKLSRYLDVIEKQEDILIDLDNPFAESQNLVTTTDAEVNLLMEAFGANPLLNDKDLEIALSLQKYLENNPYLDMESLYETFASVGIVRFIYENGNVSGDYSRNLNIVGIYDYLAVDKEDYCETLQHELVHSTGHLDNYMLDEGMTTLICSEYFSDFKITNAYCDHVLMTKVFCELITSDKMLEAYSKQDMTIIKTEMLKLNPNEEDYEKLLTVMQEYGKRFKETEKLNNFAVDNKELIHQMIDLLIPYLQSEKLDLDTKTEIVYYMGNLGQWEVNGYKAYFNTSDDESTIIKNPYVN